MAIKVVTVKCPECGAELSIEENRKQAFCTYCGAKILLEDENEYTYRHVDEADVTRAETERLIKLKELEWQEREREREQKNKPLKVIATIFLGCFAFSFFSMGKYAEAYYLSAVLCVVGIFFLWKPASIAGQLKIISADKLFELAKKGIQRGVEYASVRRKEDAERKKEELERRIELKRLEAEERKIMEEAAEAEARRREEAERKRQEAEERKQKEEAEREQRELQGVLAILPLLLLFLLLMMGLMLLAVRK